MRRASGGVFQVVECLPNKFEAPKFKPQEGKKGAALHLTLALGIRFFA
jgi:hypothetical protein